MSFYVLFVCKCVLYYCHRVTTQLELTNISYYLRKKFELKSLPSCVQATDLFGRENDIATDEGKILRNAPGKYVYLTLI